MTTRRDFVGACVFGSVLSAAAGSLKAEGPRSASEASPAAGEPAAAREAAPFRPEAAAANSAPPLGSAPPTHSANVLSKQPTPAVKDADAWIHRAMREHWSKPERLLWRIVYHPIKGLTAQSSWHIEGTHWWVRLNPGWVKLDEFDKAKTYEIDAVALDQNYGVIDFYVYEKRIVT